MENMETMERYVAEPQMDSDDPRDWNDSVTILIYSAAIGRGVDKLDDNTGPLAAFLAAYDVMGNSDMRTDRGLRAARHWANVYGDGEHVETRTIRGYSQGDWWDCVAVGRDSATVDAALNQFGQWLRGDVYVVARETAKRCNLGELHWTTWDAEGGYFADSEADAISQYRANNANMAEVQPCQICGEPIIGYLCPDCADTTATEPIVERVCVHCGKAVDPDDGGAIWYHVENMSTFCDGDDDPDLSRQAEPLESAEILPEGDAS